jgi:SpoVK/Ycf46/Vps4 family AAA+-type ATPase
MHLVFLRLIEYYQGILFLTTNRLDEFDDAFQSRIHLTVNYQPLTDVKRAAIWKNLLDQITPGHWAAEAVARLSREYNINGREIKNLIRTAAALAEHDGVLLSEEHIQTVFNLNTESNNNKTEKNTLKVLL